MSNTLIESSEELQPTESPQEPPKPKRKRRILIAILCVLAAILLLLGAAVAYTAMPVTMEIGEEIHIPALERIPPLTYICRVVTDTAAIDTNVLGEHELTLEYFGFLPITTTLRICDTIPPKLETRALYIMSGYELVPEDFVVSITDATDVTLAFDSEIDNTADGTVNLTATDEGGNTSTYQTHYVVDPNLSSCVYELGLSLREIESELMKLHDFEFLELDAIDTENCGIYSVRAKYDGRTCLFLAEIYDTVAPTATVHSFDLLLGQTLEIEDFVTDIVDESEVTATYVTEPDFEQLGKQQIKIKLEDASGNTTSYEAQINIHNVKPVLEFEIGTPTITYYTKITKLLNTTSGFPRLAENFEIDTLPIGTYETTLIGEYSTIPLEIVIVDTTAPKLTLRELQVYTGDRPSAQDFVVSCTDRSMVTISYANSFDVSKEAKLTVTIVAKDAAGNTTSKQTTLRVVKDRVAPVIYGVKNLTAYEGDSLSYRQGVYAVDDRDGQITVKVDASKVKTSVVGTYYVTYTATDKDGNTTKSTARVTINPINNNAVNPLADQVLSQIITKSMTDKQKARAIYDWCTKNIKYSTSTSHLMGYYAKAAYSGFKLHYGNCYTYYAVASALLTRAGISNIVIQRNDPDDPHYWNLVKIGGSWYHFDTCPQPSPHKLEVFLLTDKQLASFT